MLHRRDESCFGLLEHGDVDAVPNVVIVYSRHCAADSISTSPETVLVSTPPLLTRFSNTSFDVSSPNEVLGLLAGFEAVVVRADTGDYVDRLFVNASSPQSPDAASLEQTVSITGLSTGRVRVDVWAVDVLGNTGPAVHATTTVDQVSVPRRCHGCPCVKPAVLSIIPKG